MARLLLGAANPKMELGVLFLASFQSQLTRRCVILLEVALLGVFSGNPKLSGMQAL